MHVDNHIRGESLLRKILDGISKTTYGTKKIVRAVLNSVFFKSRSFIRPNDLAFAMFTRSRKARRYRIQRKGITRRSILAMSFFSVV